METEKQKELWKLAKKRVSFKRHLTSYLIINTFLWLIWALDISNVENSQEFAWPVFCTLGWGIGVAFDYLGTYVFPKSNSIEKEFERLKSKNI